MNDTAQHQRKEIQLPAGTIRYREAGSGKPIVSTGFPHAVELLSSGAGLIVDGVGGHAICELAQRSGCPG